MNIIKDDLKQKNSKSLRRLELSYQSDRKSFQDRLRRADRSIEEAEDMVHDLYAETLERIPLFSGIINLSAWLTP